MKQMLAVSVPVSKDPTYERQQLHFKQN